MSRTVTPRKTSALRRLGYGCQLLAFACLSSGVAEAQGPPSALIQAPAVYPGAVNTIPNGVAMGDFNGDGYLDFAVVEYNPSVATDGQVEIFLGNADGSFTASAVYPIGTVAGQPYATNHIIGVGHFNGPSMPLGIAIAVNQALGCTSGGVVVLYGNGDGTFQTPTCLANPTGVTSVAISDYNNDGFDDIAVGNASGAAAGTLTVYLNIANINSSTNQSGFYFYGNYSVGITSVTGAVTTLYGTIVTAKNSLRYEDGPSIALLATTGTFSQYVSAFENSMVEVNGGPLFLDFFQSTPLAISGDVFSDIAWVGPDLNPSSLVGIGAAGGLQSITTTFVTGDGGAVLGPVITLQSSDSGLAMAVVDFDGNGVADIAYLDGNQNLNILLNPGSTPTSKIGPFGPKGQGVAAGFSTGLNEWVVVDAGIDQQLSPLLASYNAARSVAVFLVNPTTGEPAIAPIYKQSSSYATLTQGAQHAFAVADFNGVGVPDVAVLGEDPANFDATVSIFQNAYKTATPPGYATPPTVIDLGTLLGAGNGTLGGSPGYAMVTGSFRVFDPDIAIVTSGGITLLENQGANTQSPYNFILAPNCQGFFGAPTTAANTCDFSNDKNISSEYPGLSSANKVRPAIIAADMNGDGYQDIVVAYPETCSVDTRSAIFVFLSNGDGTFQAPIYIASPVVNPIGIVAGNFLGHSVPDLVVINGGEICSGTEVFSGPQTSVGAALIPNNGGGVFSTTAQTILSQTSDVPWPSYSAVATADMNGDGAPDLVISATDGLHVLLNTPGSLGTFTDQGTVPLYGPADFITNAAQIDIADLNKDGFLDVAAAVGGIVYVFPGDGKGGLSTPVQAFASGLDSNQVRAIDVNGDGTADVVVNNSVGFSVLLNSTTAATGSPIAQFSDLTLSYGGIVEGASETMAVTLSNAGTGPMTLTQWSFANNTGNQFAVTQWQCGTTSQPPFPIYLTPTSGCTFFITYTPNALGILNAQILFYDDASASNAPSAPTTGPASFQQTINLTGGGLQATANVSINVSVSPIPVLVGSAMIYTVKLTNSGPNPATNLIFTHQFEPSVLFASSSTSQGSCSGTGAYGALASCSMGTLPVGATATVQLYASPSVATTLANGFSITEDETDSNPETVSYNVIVVTSLTVAIPTITETIAVSDTPTFPDIPVSETLNVSDQVTVTPLINVNGVAAVDLSPVALGYSNTAGTQTITLSNVGQAPLTLGGYTIAGSHFTPGGILCWNGTTSWPSTLPSGEACTLTINYDGTTGATGTLTFTDSAGLSNVLQSGGVSPNFTQSIALSGAGTNTTAPPPSATVTIPTVMEDISVSDAPTFPDISGTEAIKISDQVTVTPLINVNGVAAVDLSPVALGYSNTAGTQTITLSNVGQASLTLQPYIISGSAFSVSGVVCWNGTTSWPPAMPSGGACTLSITYSGTNGATGTLTFTDSASLSNALQSGGASPNFTQSIALSGAGTNTTAPPPLATVTIPTVNETINVTDAPKVPNTDGGVNVLVIPVDTTTGTTPVTLTFANVTQPGVTSLTTSSTGPPAPTGFQLGTPGVYYNLSTTATYTGSVMICINYTGITFTQAPAIFHYQNGAWTNITSSLNTTIKLVCGTTTSFSPFALFQPIAIPTTTAISAAGFTYGTQGSVTVSVSSTAGTVTGNVSLSVDGGTASTMALTNGSALFSVGILSAGSHSLSASFAAQGSFLASSASGTISVTQAPLAIAANNLTKNFDAPNPTLTWTASGFVNGDSTSVLTTLPTCSTTATTTSPAGSYPITCSGAAGANYTFTYVPGTLTVLAVTCHYVSIGLSPSTVAEGGLITVSWTLRSCASTTQTVAFSFTLSGPAQPDSCSPTKTEMFSLPPFALKPNTLQSLSFPFRIPKRGCPGTYTTTVTTTINGQAVDTSSTSLTITAP